MNKGIEPVFKYVDCIQLYVPDLDSGLEYYCSGMGLKLIWKTEHAIGLGLLEDKTEIVLQDERQEIEVDIKVDSVFDAVEEIKRAGGQIIYGPFDIAIGKCAVIRDPWGNQYVILDSSKGTFVTDDSGNILGLKTD